MAFLENDGRKTEADKRDDDYWRIENHNTSAQQCAESTAFIVSAPGHLHPLILTKRFRLCT